jgi:hypothetical protein
MSGRTHIETRNSDSYGYLIDSFRSYHDQIALALRQLDGSKRWAYSLWRAPAGVYFYDIDMNWSQKQYLQTAGSAEAMTIEVRFVEDDGKARQYVVGRPGGDYSEQPAVTLRFLDETRKLHLYPNEVFEWEEAADIYYQYFLTDRVPEPYVLRRLDFSAYE